MRKNRSGEAENSWVTTRARLGLGLLTILTTAAMGCGGDDDAAAPAASGCIQLADGSCVEETFHNPPLLQPDANGVYQLELKPTEFTFNGQRHCGRGYNGQYPAPTIDTAAAKDGEKRQVRVNLRNRFTKDDYQSLLNEVCTCSNPSNGSSCTPSGGHGGDPNCMCTNADGDMCEVFNFNVTNLHFHGSHVRPDYAAGGGCTESDGLNCRTCTGDTSTGNRECFFSDDVISRVKPGAGAQHRFDLDEDGTHHAGLSWYHPHIHGSTAIQVAGGAAGAWIVRGKLDEIDGIKNAKERVIVLSTPPGSFTPLKDGDPCDEDHITFDHFTTLEATPNKADQANLVNGLQKPRMIMPPGQIERWRFVDASFLDETQIVVFRGKDSECKDLNLDAGPIALTQIGRDGLPLPKPADGAGWPYAPPYIFMSTGYRVEALLDGSKLVHGDTLCVMSARALQSDSTGTTGAPVGYTKVPTPEEIIKAASNGEVIAVVNVTNAAGSPTETKMPDLAVVAAEAPSMMLQGGTLDALAKCEEVKKINKLDEIDQLAALWLVFYNTEGLDKCGFMDHNINAKNFEGTDRTKYPYDRVFKKGAVDHWRLISGFDGHPFHIHINPYLVCPLPPEGSSDPNVKSRIFEPPFAHWRDTYLVNLDRTVDVLTEYRGFTGAYVYHCHKLTHEDHGMMELLRVCDPDTEDCDTLCDGGKCGWNSCAAGDDNCERKLVATKCLANPADPTQPCPEALLRCTTCDNSQACPPNAHCSDSVADDNLTRCAPGCVDANDCAITDTCTAGNCVAAPCTPPCGPGQMCNHGACQ